MEREGFGHSATPFFAALYTKSWQDILLVKMGHFWQDVLYFFVFYFYFKKCLEIRHNFCKPFWDKCLQILTHYGPFWAIFDNF